MSIIECEDLDLTFTATGVVWVAWPVLMLHHGRHGIKHSVTRPANKNIRYSCKTPQYLAIYGEEN